MRIRFSAVLALLALVLGILAGCSKPAPETPKTPAPIKQEPVTITYMTFSAAPDHLGDLDKIVQAFQKENPLIKVDVRAVAWNDYWTKLPTVMAGDAAPDAFELNYENFVDYAKKGLLMDLGPLASADKSFDPKIFYPKAHAAFNYSGKQYGLVETFSTVLLFYNKDMFDAKGMAYPTANWTWDDEIEAAKRLTDTQKGVWGTFQPIQFWEFFKVAAQGGGSVLDKSGKPVLNTPENIAALQQMVDRIHKYKVAPSAEQAGTLGDGDLFKQQKVAMIHTGIWMFNDFKAVPFKWDVAVEPGKTKDSKANHFFANAVVIAKNSKNAQAAWAWSKYLTSSKTAAQTRIDTGWEIPALSDPKLVEGYLKQTTPANRQAVFDALNNPVTVPVIDNFQMMTDEVGKELELAKLGKKSPKDALDAAQKKLQ